MTEEWTESTTARQRVETIATTLSEPRSTNWIAEQAEVTWDTASTHLEDLAASGLLLETDDGSYVPDPTRAYFDRLRKLIVENERMELRDELATIAERIDERRTTYDVESIDDLEATLADDRPPKAIEERRRALRRWENDRDAREMIRTALDLYDDVRTLTDAVPSTARSRG